MNQIRTTALALSFAAVLSACGGGGNSGAPAPAPAPPAGGPVDDEVVVQLKLGADVNAIAAAYQLTVVDQFGKRPIWRLQTTASGGTAAAIAALRADARVLFAEPNAENETPEGRRRSLWAVGGDATTYATQWAPAALRLPEAHAHSLGAGMRVAVLDTGIDLAHPALAGRLARNSGALLGRDFVDDDADPSEEGTTANLGFGHGTHVAGLVSLVAPQATLMPARVLDREGRGNVWVLAEALAWAVDPDGNPATDDGAHVINLSLGTTQPTDLLRVAVALADCDFDDDDDDFEDPGFDDDKARCASKYGALVLAAAGNDGSDTQQLFPAAEAVPGSLALAASTETRTLAPFSNRGSWVELAAPGERIVSTVPGGGYGSWSGTSMATPLAAGTAALVLATFADPRGVLPLDIANRLAARSSLLCGTALRNVDAAAAVTDTQAVDPVCN
jgi:subtilisin family serine protease